jgi:hypothetical protein
MPPVEEPDKKLVVNLKLEVRETYRPGRWMWQLVDVRDGRLFERAFEFESARDAERSGVARLAELTRYLPVQRRTCLLCGRAFTIFVPRDKPGNDQAKLCGDCASLPEPPEEPKIGR